MKSLAVKIIIWFFIPAAIILSAVAFYIFYSYQQVAEELTYERNQEVTRLVANQVGISLDENVELLNDIAQTAGFYEYDQAAQQDLLTANQRRLSNFDAGVLILDTFGRVLASEPEQTELIGNDFKDSVYFIGLVRSMMDDSSQPFISDLIQDDEYASKVIATAVPIVNERREFIGAVIGLHRLAGSEIASLLPLLFADRETSESAIALIDGTQHIIAHSHPSAVGMRYPDSDSSAQAEESRPISSPIIPLRTSNQTINSASIPGTHWTLIIENPLPDLAIGNRNEQALLLVLLGLGVFIPVLLVTVGVRRVMHPIRALIKASQEVAEGNFGHSIEARSGDEIEELASQFNVMSTRLKETYTNLEATLSRRTNELATLNAISASVSSSLDLQEILDIALENTLKIMNTNAGGVYLLEKRREELQLASYRGFEPASASAIDNLAVGEGFSGRVVELRENLVIEDLSEDPRLTRDIVKQIGYRSLASVPLISRREVLGTLFVLTCDVRRFSEQELELLTSIGHQLGAAVDSAQLLEQSQKAAALEERQRLARDLHDAVTQTLFSASLIAEVLPRIWDKDPEEGILRSRELRELTRGALAEMRSLLVELRPAALVDAQLPDLLNQLAEATTGKARIPVSVKIDGTCDLPVDVKVAMYYIAQEALNNVVKHANASSVEISLECLGDSVANLHIIDDGQGFDSNDVSPGEFGLGIMEERAKSIDAEFEKKSELGVGTRIITYWNSGDSNPS